MRTRVLVLPFAVASLVLVGVLPAASSAKHLRDFRTQEHYTVKCSSSTNACEEVVNAYQGSDYVYRVYVWTTNNATNPTPHTFRLLFDQSPRYSWYGDLGTVFYLNYSVNPGRCIQGGVEGLQDARTPCWYAP